MYAYAGRHGEKLNELFFRSSWGRAIHIARDLPGNQFNRRAEDAVWIDSRTFLNGIADTAFVGRDRDAYRQAQDTLNVADGQTGALVHTVQQYRDAIQEI